MTECESLLDNLEDLTQSEIKLHKKRWFVALIIGMQLMCVRFLENSIGIVNDVYVEYFNISYSAVDWFSIIQFPGSIVGNFVVAFLIYKQYVGLRRLSILVSAMTVFAGTAMFTASVIPRLYPLIYIGEFSMGVAFAITRVMIIEMANIWFPENEIGKALAVTSISTGSASILACLVPSNIFENSSSSQDIFKNQNMSHVNDGLERSMWFFVNKRAFLKYYGALNVIVIAIFGLVLKTMKDKPPKPPSNVQAQLRNSKTTHANAAIANDSTTHLKPFFQECKNVLTNDVFVLLSLVTIIRRAFISVLIIFLSEVLRPINLNSNFETAPNVLSGYVMVSYNFTLLIGSFVSSYIFDHFKKHMLQLSLSVFFMFIMSLGMLLGTYYGSVIAIWIFNALSGFAIVFSGGPIRDITVQHLHPIKPGFISALQELGSFVGAIMIAQVSRFILNYGGGLGMFTFHTMLLLFSLFVCYFLKPNFRRLQINL